MPTLVYFPVAGRGELCRLIATVGGIENFEEVGALPEGVSPADCGSTGSMPCFIDGDLKMNESGAIEVYLSLIAPKYADLTPQQRGKDTQLAQIKESILGAFAGIVFGLSAEERAAGAKKVDVEAVAKKFFTVLEGILPEDGFVNGLDIPTVGDLAIVNICEGYMPFGAAYKYAGLDLAAAYPNPDKYADHHDAVRGLLAHPALVEGAGAHAHRRDELRPGGLHR